MRLPFCAGLLPLVTSRTAFVACLPASSRSFKDARCRPCTLTNIRVRRFGQSYCVSSFGVFPSCFLLFVVHLTGSQGRLWWLRHFFQAQCTYRVCGVLTLPWLPARHPRIDNMSRPCPKANGDGRPLQRPPQLHHHPALGSDPLTRSGCLGADRSAPIPAPLLPVLRPRPTEAACIVGTSQM